MRNSHGAARTDRRGVRKRPDGSPVPAIRALSVLLALIITGIVPTETATAYQSGPKPTADPGSTAAPSASLQTPTVVTRVLDFGEVPVSVPVSYRLRFGSRRHQVGWIDPCRDGCHRLCPCSTTIQPSSFDLDDRGRVWIVDSAKQRVAVFDSAGMLAHVFRGGGIRVGSTDIHVSPLRTLVIGQERGATYFSEIVDEDLVLKQPVVYRGERVHAGSFFHEDGQRFSSVALIPQGEGEIERVQPVEFAFDGRQEHALDVPGRPYRSGWLLNDRSPEDEVTLKVDSAAQPMDLVIRFRFRQPVNGGQRFVQGAVPYDLEIDDAGHFHILLKAGTFGRVPREGHWYLRVSSVGEVGRPVRLRDPRRPDDQQQRHLALDEEGRPYYMTPGRRALLIQDLSSL